MSWLKKLPQAFSWAGVVDTVFSLKPVTRDLLSMVTGPTTVVAVESQMAVVGGTSRLIVQKLSLIFLTLLVLWFCLALFVTLYLMTTTSMRHGHRTSSGGKGRVRQDRKCQLFYNDFD